MRNKELFFNLNSSGKRVSMKAFRERPVDYKKFINIISEIKNVNINNIKWLKIFYNKYIYEFFPDVTSKSLKEYNKYYWNNECLRLNSNSVTDEYWLQRGWTKEELIERRKERYATGTIDFQKNKYNLSEEEAENKLKNRQSIIKNKRKKIYKEYLEKDKDYFKKKCGYSVEHFIDKGYSKTDAIKKSNEVSRKVSKKNKKWAKEASKNKDYWNSRTETQLNYWLAKGYSEEDARQKLKERQQTFTKEKLISKYGEKDGLKKWKDRQEKWKKNVFNDKQWLGGGCSKVSNDLFEKVIKELNLHENDCLYGIKNEKYISNSNNHFKYDFTYLLTKKIIEFHGDYWHCNPALYEVNYQHKIKNMAAKEIWA
ncbi:MAG: hypothetical protein ACOC56_02645, partial [Atribacterota bacterium]